MDIATFVEGFPHLLEEWDHSANGPLEDFQGRRSTPVWWTCSLGHKWKNSVHNRGKLGQGCPYCAGKKVWAGFNDLATVSPSLAQEWHPTKNSPLLPTEVGSRSDKKIWWQCKEQHEWVSTPLSRSKGSRCPYCSHRKLWVGFNDLETMLPELALQWHYEKNDGLLPSEVLFKSGKRVWWRCHLDPEHEWQTAISHRASGARTGCPFCKGKKLSVANSFAGINPGLADYWHPTKNGSTLPSQIRVSTTSPYWWVCKSGHEFTASPAVVHRGAKLGYEMCPYCSNREVLKGFNDLTTLNPDLARLWHPTKNAPLLPDDIYGRSTKRVWWMGSCGHEWSRRVTEMLQTRNLCPVCGWKKQLPKKTDSLSENYPHLAAQWHPDKNSRTVDSVTFGSNVRAWWRCEKGHEWQVSVHSRTYANSGCPQCFANSFVSTIEDDLHETLQALGVTEIIRSSRRLIPPQEIDLFLPKHNVAIEVNGVYWHSEKFKEADYHLKKHEACAEKGVRLIQVWEDDWRDRKNIVIRNLAHQLRLFDSLEKVLPKTNQKALSRIGARKTKVKIVEDFSEAEKFLEENHIQGAATGTHYLALTDKEEDIRALLVIKKRPRFPGEWLIERYATCGLVSGGFTKLLAHASNMVSPTAWVTFADKEISDGALYEMSGFTKEKSLPPDYSYLVNASRVHKFNYRKERFRKDPELLWEPGLSERELARLNNLLRIWDSGKVRYVKRLS